jgi:hypothetical protein
MLQTALLSNTLVCLPTGLGKTLIAAVVMHNFARWFPEVGLEGGGGVLCGRCFVTPCVYVKVMLVPGGGVRGWGVGGVGGVCFDACLLWVCVRVSGVHLVSEGA